MLNTILESEHLRFRPMTEDDTDLILKWRNSDAVKSNFLYRKDITRDQHLERFYTKVRSGEVIQFIIIDKDMDEPIGSVYLRDVDTVRKRAEYGIFIGEDNARGKGFGSETASRIVDFFFNELKLDLLYLRVLTGNKIAINSYKSAGFKECKAEDIGIVLDEGPDRVICMAVTDNR